MKFLNTYFSKKIVYCWVFAIELFIIGVLIYNCQSNFKIEILSNIPTEVFKVTVQSLLVFIPFVGAMLIFGLGRIRDELKLKGALYTDELKNLREGWKEGIKLFLSFSLYVSMVVFFNIGLLIFHKMNTYTLGFLLGDTALIFGALYLMVGIGVKIFDLDKELL